MVIIYNSTSCPASKFQTSNILCIKKCSSQTLFKTFLSSHTYACLFMILYWAQVPGTVSQQLSQCPHCAVHCGRSMFIGNWGRGAVESNIKNNGRHSGHWRRGYWLDTISKLSIRHHLCTILILLDTISVRILTIYKFTDDITIVGQILKKLLNGVRSKFVHIRGCIGSMIMDWECILVGHWCEELLSSMFSSPILTDFCLWVRKLRIQLQWSVLEMSLVGNMVLECRAIANK